MSKADPTEELSSRIKNVGLDESKDINILLLGSTGVGKSTFINSIANYMTFADLKTARKEESMVLIPSKFSVKDKHNELKEVSIGGADQNEYLDVGESATQDVKTYVFPIWNRQTHVRLIDTPGVGDTRGIKQDDENSENILSYIAQLHELHAICFLLKPNESRNTVYFKYCMSQILSRLEKSASKNILFIFTNTRGTDYGPGETISILKKTIDEIQKQPPYCEIPLNRNIFCFENESFKYLAAIKNNIEFDAGYSKVMSTSWKNSTEQCWKMIKYIVGDSSHAPLKPHFVKSTSAINEARRMITHLSQPLAEISQLINQNVALLERHKQNLNIDQNSVEQLKKKLYMPVANLEAIKLTQPVTVCTSSNCAEVYKVGERNNWHYKQRCHDPCYLRNVPKEIIGSPELVNCASMSNRECVKCACSFSIHMHVYYLTKVKEDRQLDPNIQRNIDTKEKVLENTKKLINDMNKRKLELEEEHRIIITCCAKFAHFLQNNAITPYNDAYKEYISYLIDREKSLGYLCDMGSIHYLQKLLAEYEEMKKSFDDALKLNIKLNRQEAAVTAKEVQDSIQKLYNLKHNGKKIKELYECQKKSRRKEFENTEYVHNHKFIEKKESEKTVKTSKDQKPSKVASNTRRGTTRQFEGRSQNPPSYEEDQRHRSGSTYPQSGPSHNYPPHGFPYPPPGGPWNPPPNYWPNHPPANQYPSYPSQPIGGYPNNDHRAQRTGSTSDDQYSINISLRKPTSDQGPPPPQQAPWQNPSGHYAPPNNAYQPPNNSYPYGQYPPPPTGPYYGPPAGYPSGGPAYHSQRGVNRNDNRHGNVRRETNYDRGNRRGGARGGRARGGINKNYKPRRTSNRNKNSESDEESDASSKY